MGYQGTKQRGMGICTSTDSHASSFDDNIHPLTIKLVLLDFSNPVLVDFSARLESDLLVDLV